jgi:hypothetical protein
MGHALALERHRQIRGKLTPLMLPLLGQYVQLFLGSLLVEVMLLGSGKCVSICAHTIHVAEASDKLLLLFDVGLGEDTEVREVDSVRRVTNEWVMRLVSSHVCALAIPSLFLVGLRCTNHVSTFEILVVGVVRGRECSRGLVVNLELSFL